MFTRDGSYIYWSLIVFVQALVVVRTIEHPELNNHDCSHAWSNGWRKDGVYSIRLNAASQPFDVFCRMTSTGGFTVIQRRMDGSTNFDRSWNDYKNGFGSLEGEHWLGLDTIHLLTQSAYNPKGVGLRVELGDFKGVFKYADYSFFVVLTEDLNYTMLLNGFNGTAGNSLGDHNSMQFSTKDRDNDLLSFKNCARDLKGGWWFTEAGCYSAFLNGPYSACKTLAMLSRYHGDCSALIKHN
eukprot:Em0021g144a